MRATHNTTELTQMPHNTNPPLRALPKSQRNVAELYKIRRSLRFASGDDAFCESEESVDCFSVGRSMSYEE